MAKSEQEPRIGIINAINSPLGFYVLSLLIVETFLATVLVGMDKRIPPESVVVFIYLGVAMFIFVVAVVSVLAWAKPTNITFNQFGHLQNAITGLSDQVKANKRLDEALRDAQFYRAQHLHLEAVYAYQRALSVDPESEEAKIGLAVCKSYLNPDNMSEPLTLLNDVIKSNPRSAKAYYNRACIRCIDKSKDWSKEYLDDLKKAIEIRVEYREYPKGDQDFDKVKKEDRDFQLLIYGHERQ